MKIVIYGAGSIGCYLGATLQAGGLPVTLLGRARLADMITTHGGLEISDYQGGHERVTNIDFSTSPDVLATADLVLVTLKCTAMTAAVEELVQYHKPGAMIVCLQNGVGSDEIVRPALPDCRVVKGCVPFNVVQGDDARFHRATAGVLMLPIEPELQAIRDACRNQGLECEFSDDMNAIVWGKLLLNLNNAINALSDLPLKQQLSHRGYRMLLSDCQIELINACKKRNIELAKLTSVGPELLPYILRLPDWAFRLLARKMLAIDPEARSSMWEDTQAGRKTEIEFLNGAVVAMAEQQQLIAPANKLIADLIGKLEAGELKAGLSAEDLQRQYEESKQAAIEAQFESELD